MVYGLPKGLSFTQIHTVIHSKYLKTPYFSTHGIFVFREMSVTIPTQKDKKGACSRRTAPAKKDLTRLFRLVYRFSNIAFI